MIAFVGHQCVIGLKGLIKGQESTLVKSLKCTLIKGLKKTLIKGLKTYLNQVFKKVF